MIKLPQKYKSQLGLKETEHAIVAIKDFFQTALSTELNLSRVTAPLFVKSGIGINDDLNGVEKPVSFQVRDMGGQKMEIPEHAITGICEAARQTLDLEKAGQYLSEKLPSLLAEMKKIFPALENDLFFGQ